MCTAGGPRGGQGTISGIDEGCNEGEGEVARLKNVPGQEAVVGDSTQGRRGREGGKRCTAVTITSVRRRGWRG